MAVRPGAPAVTYSVTADLEEDGWIFKDITDAKSFEKSSGPSDSNYFEYFECQDAKGWGGRGGAGASGAIYREIPLEEAGSGVPLSYVDVTFGVCRYDSDPTKGVALYVGPNVDAPDNDPRWLSILKVPNPVNKHTKVVTQRISVDRFRNRPWLRIQETGSNVLLLRSLAIVFDGAHELQEAPSQEVLCPEGFDLEWHNGEPTVADVCRKAEILPTVASRECGMSGKKASGTQLISVNSAVDACDCQTECLLNPGCESWHFYMEQVGTNIEPKKAPRCQLKSDDAIADGGDHDDEFAGKRGVGAPASAVEAPRGCSAIGTEMDAHTGGAVMRDDRSKICRAEKGMVPFGACWSGYQLLANTAKPDRGDLCRKYAPFQEEDASFGHLHAPFGCKKIDLPPYFVMLNEETQPCRVAQVAGLLPGDGSCTMRGYALRRGKSGTEGDLCYKVVLAAGGGPSGAGGGGGTGGGGSNLLFTEKQNLGGTEKQGLQGGRGSASTISRKAAQQGPLSKDLTSLMHEMDQEQDKGSSTKGEDSSSTRGEDPDSLHTSGEQGKNGQRLHQDEDDYTKGVGGDGEAGELPSRNREQELDKDKNNKGKLLEVVINKHDNAPAADGSSSKRSFSLQDAEHASSQPKQELIDVSQKEQEQQGHQESEQLHASEKKQATSASAKTRRKRRKQHKQDPLPPGPLVPPFGCALSPATNTDESPLAGTMVMLSDPNQPCRVDNVPASGPLDFSGTWVVSTAKAGPASPFHVSVVPVAALYQNELAFEAGTSWKWTFRDNAVRNEYSEKSCFFMRQEIIANSNSAGALASTETLMTVNITGPATVYLDHFAGFAKNISTQVSGDPVQGEEQLSAGLFSWANWQRWSRSSGKTSLRLSKTTAPGAVQLELGGESKGVVYESTFHGPGQIELKGTNSQLGPPLVFVCPAAARSGGATLTPADPASIVSRSYSFWEELSRDGWRKLTNFEAKSRGSMTLTESTTDRFHYPIASTSASADASAKTESSCGFVGWGGVSFGGEGGVMIERKIPTIDPTTGASLAQVEISFGYCTTSQAVVATGGAFIDVGGEKRTTAESATMLSLVEGKGGYSSASGRFVSASEMSRGGSSRASYSTEVGEVAVHRVRIKQDEILLDTSTTTRREREHLQDEDRQEIEAHSSSSSSALEDDGSSMSHDISLLHQATESETESAMGMARNKTKSWQRVSWSDFPGSSMLNPVMEKDEAKNELICEDDSFSFEKRGNDATEDLCKSACLGDILCAAFAFRERQFCHGCRGPLRKPANDDKVKGYVKKKTRERKLLQAVRNQVPATRTIRLPGSLFHDSRKALLAGETYLRIGAMTGEVSGASTTQTPTILLLRELKLVYRPTEARALGGEGKLSGYSLQDLDCRKAHHSEEEASSFCSRDPGCSMIFEADADNVPVWYICYIYPVPADVVRQVEQGR
ncbi:unnamed protein product [Amoebophrya sp. A25]|nr:unnamed protein product [Amoebophrya sp. A25]|eukprot:GSA25T00006673001.1